MYQKLNQNRAVKITLSTVAVAMLFSFASLLPYHEVDALNALGTFVGGRVTSSFPAGYVWYNGGTAMYCPPHIWVASFGAPYRGPIPLLIPPGIPKGNYN